MRRATLVLTAAMVATLIPNGATAAGTLDGVDVVQAFAARFDLDNPPRQIRVIGSVSGSAAAFFIPPAVPAASHALVFDGCVQLRRGATLPVRDEACGEWQMFADPTLTFGTFAGQMPSDEGTITATVQFAGTSPPNEPAPVTTLPPFATVQLTLLRQGTAVGFVQSDQGEGMAAGELGQDDNALMTQILKADSAVFAP